MTWRFDFPWPATPTALFGLPPNRVVELGMQVEI